MISSIPHFPLLLGVTVALPRSVFLPGVIRNVQIFFANLWERKVLFSGTDSHLVYDWMITRMTKVDFLFAPVELAGKDVDQPRFLKAEQGQPVLKNI